MVDELLSIRENIDRNIIDLSDNFRSLKHLNLSNSDPETIKTINAMTVSMTHQIVRLGVVNTRVMGLWATIESGEVALKFSTGRKLLNDHPSSNSHKSHMNELISSPSLYNATNMEDMDTDMNIDKIVSESRERLAKSPPPHEKEGGPEDQEYIYRKSYLEANMFH